MKIHDLLNIESSYINMGARQYDPALGRFLSPDPLLEAFPGQSPYNYAFNSPLLWSDPSGLAPEKEQKRDRIMVFDFKNLDLAEQYLQAALEEIEAGRALEHSLEAQRRQSERDKRWSSSRSSGGNRTGEASYKFNGASIAWNGRSAPDIAYHYMVSIPTSNGENINLPTTIYHSGLEGNSPLSVIDAYVSGINNILNLDNTYFDNLVGHDISIEIVNQAKLTYNGVHVPGICTNFENGSSRIRFSVKAIMNPHKFKYEDINGKWFDYQLHIIIAHEFAHAIHHALLGKDLWDYKNDEDIR